MHGGRRKDRLPDRAAVLDEPCERESVDKDYETWRIRYGQLVDCFSEVDGHSSTKLNNAFIDFTKSVTSQCHPSFLVLRELGCLEFFVNILAKTTDTNVLSRTLTLLDRLVTFSGPDIFNEFEVMVEQWNSILVRLFHSLLACDELELAYLVIKCVKTSSAFSEVFAKNIYSPEFIETIKAWLTRIYTTKTTDEADFRMISMIHHCIFEQFGPWLLHRDVIPGIDIEFLVQNFVLAFDNPHELIREQTCNLLLSIIGKSKGDIWALWIRSGIFGKVAEMACTSHSPAAMDLMSEGLITEEYAEYFASLGQFQSISTWICQFFVEFLESSAEQRQEIAGVFASSIALLSNCLVSKHLSLEKEITHFLLDKASQLLEEAPFEAKDPLAFMVFVLVKGITVEQLPEYLSILSCALDIAAAGSEDVVQQSFETITTIMDMAQAAGIDLQTLDGFDEVIRYVRGIVDNFEECDIETEGNAILDRIEDELGIRID